MIDTLPNIVSIGVNSFRRVLVNKTSATLFGRDDPPTTREKTDPPFFPEPGPSQ